MTSRKRAGFVAGAGIGAAAAIGLRRRWAARDGGDGVAPAGAPGEAGAAFLEHLAAAIRIPTVSSEDPADTDFDQFVAFREFLEGTYPEVHRVLDRDLLADHTLLFTWRGSDPSRSPIVLMAHQDVVPVEEGTEDDWELPPFAGDSDGSHLYGRGSLDDKGALIAILEAVEAMLGAGFTPTATVYLAFGHDEEVLGVGAAAVAAKFEEEGIRPSLVIDEGGAVAVDFFPGVSEPVALVGIGEKGYMDVELTARGEGGHSSAPPPSTAIGKVAGAVRALERNPMPARLDMQRGLLETLGGLVGGAAGRLLRRPDLFGALIDRRMSSAPTTNALIRTTGAATIIRGGLKSNVLPQDASALVNFRIMPGDSGAAVLDHVRGTVGPDVSVEVKRAQEPPAVADPGSAQFATLAEIIGEVFGVAAVAPWVLTGATDSRHFVGVADQVLRFSPFVASAEDLKRFHGTGERIRLADADRAVGFFRTLLERVAG
jgi:carboxypeptidase PM20D1